MVVVVAVGFVVSAIVVAVGVRFAICDVRCNDRSQSVR